MRIVGEKNQKLSLISLIFVVLAAFLMLAPSVAHAQVMYTFHTDSGVRVSETAPLVVNKGDSFVISVRLNSNGATLDLIRASLGLTNDSSAISYDTATPFVSSSNPGFSPTGRPVDLRTNGNTVVASIRLEPDQLATTANEFNANGAITSGFTPAADAAFNDTVVRFTLSAENVGLAFLRLLNPVYTPNDSTGILISSALQDGASILTNAYNSTQHTTFAETALVVVNFATAPTPLTPANNYQSTDDSVTFSWSFAEGGAAGYEIALYQGENAPPSDFSANPDTVILVEGAATTAATLNDTGYYAWRVRAYGDSNVQSTTIYSSYSAIRNFQLSQEQIARIDLVVDSNASLISGGTRHCTVTAYNQFDEVAVSYGNNTYNDTFFFTINTGTIDAGNGQDTVLAVSGTADTIITFTFAGDENTTLYLVVRDRFGNMDTQVLNVVTFVYPPEGLSADQTPPPIGSETCSVAFISGSDSVGRQNKSGVIVEFYRDAGFTDLAETAVTNETGEISVGLVPGTYYVRYRSDSDASFLNKIPANPQFTVPGDVVLPAASLIVGDADHNGSINVTDFFLWMGYFNGGVEPRNADFDGNGSVNVNDFLRWMASFNSGTTDGDF